MKKFSQDGNTLVFYKKEGETRFSFYFENDKKLTDLLLSNINQKKVYEYQIKDAAKSIFAKVKNNSLIEWPEAKDNPINILQQILFKKFGTGKMFAKVVDVGTLNGDHNVIVEMELANGKIYKGSGINWRVAKQEAAKKALEELQS